MSSASTSSSTFTIVNQPETAFILKLPNEILQLSFSFLRGSSTLDTPPFHGEYNVTRYFDGDRWNIMHQPLILRYVCHRFRRIVHELPFWYTEDFTFCKLLKFSWPFRDVEMYLEELLKDEHLVACLGRKTAWKLTSVGEVAVVLRKIPQIARNVRKICLSINDDEDWDDELNPHETHETVAIRMLSACRNVKILTITHGSVDLSGIAKSFPYLEELCLEDGVEEYRGTLRNLSHLQELRIRCPNFPITNAGLIPVKSAESLEELTIFTDVEQLFHRTIPINLRSLNLFVNLTVLHIHPWDNRICKLLHAAKFQLQSFGTSFYLCDEVDSNYNDVFLAPCLEKIEDCALVVNFNRNNVPDVLPMIKLMISRFKDMESLFLMMPLNLSWLQYFSRMTKLEQLRWSVPSCFYDDSEYRGIAEYDKWNNNPNTKARKVFESHFTTTQVKPHFNLDLIPRY